MSDGLRIPKEPATSSPLSPDSTSAGAVKKRGGFGALKKPQSIKSDELAQKVLSTPPDSPRTQTEKNDRIIKHIPSQQIVEDISTQVARVTNIGEAILSPEIQPLPLNEIRDVPDNIKPREGHVQKDAVKESPKEIQKETPNEMVERGRKEFAYLVAKEFEKERPNWTNAAVTKETATAKLAKGKVGDFVVGFSPKSKHDLCLYMKVPDGNGVKLQETIIRSWQTDKGSPTGYFHHKNVEATLDDILKDYRSVGNRIQKQHEEDKDLLSMHVASKPTPQSQISLFMKSQNAGTFMISRLESSDPESSNKLQITVKLDDNRLLAYTIQPSGSDYVFLKCQMLDKDGKPNEAVVLTPGNRFDDLNFKLDESTGVPKAKLADIISVLENFRDKK